MTAFLKERGIIIKKPIHIILDEKLDQPHPVVQLYPLREIRLPMRAPGALEDGFTEPDPWRYYLFKGLCTLGIYNERSGIPKGVHRVFGEIISPNKILPEWSIDGISNLLWEQYRQKPAKDPISDAIFEASVIPGMDRVSHHPEIWPGRFSYRIYGRPFVKWLNDRYGWEKILSFIQVHGGGIIPIEIDIKAKNTFGLSWNQLWSEFQAQHASAARKSTGTNISGYLDAPYHHWNDTGIYPGIKKFGSRGRYGYLDKQNRLWLSEYHGSISKIKIQHHGVERIMVKEHVWDPGPGSVAVTRRGITPVIVVFDEQSKSRAIDGRNETIPVRHQIEGPPGVLQMSGPVMDGQGRLAVAANFKGNWDIWIYDGHWHRVTDSPSVEIDPWWIEEKLIFASNASGTFQIHGTDMRPLTQASTAALLPRNITYLELESKGWQLKSIDKKKIPSLPEAYSQPTETPPPEPESKYTFQRYSAWKSIWPNYITPDYFYNGDDLQLGLTTNARDVSQSYYWDAGIRYDFNEEEFTWRLGYHAKRFKTRVTRYPVSYTPQRGTGIDEIWTDASLSWAPNKLKSLSVSGNWRRYKQESNRNETLNEWWANIKWSDEIGGIQTIANLDLFDDGSQSIYGELLYWRGEHIKTIMRIQGGKTWGDVNAGHNTFRIGGNAGEGYFTRRSSRLFSLRGFDSDILEADTAATASLDVLWPCARLQSGYKTLPLFLHNITLSTFVDAGFASDNYDADELLIGAGIEIITGMELAWSNKSHFSIGVAWPLKKPDDIEQDGPTFLILIGRPL